MAHGHIIHDSRLDGGAGFDWGRTSAAYARYRDIYPPGFWQPLLDAGLFRAGSDVLDIGTGTGVLPRALCGTGAHFTATDISPEQVAEARRLSEGLPIRYHVCPAERLPFPDASFDTITACQCFFYFDHPAVVPLLARLLRPGGRLAVTYLAWLPEEDAVAGASERLVLQYNPGWTGAGERRRPVSLPDIVWDYFEPEQSGGTDMRIPFTRESWAGRIFACRGVGASMEAGVLEKFTQAHRALLDEIAPEHFEVLHYAAYAILRVKG